MQLLVFFCLLLAIHVQANEEIPQNRGSSKVPYIADAVGNTLPPPSNGPAAIGSPSKLLTPDRYEFYTFDESGELVKRLMTLDEIQAIVAAGEGTDGHLVTLSNEDQPTIAFNFSQPPYTKVHSVVTNVQNVLKAQMEAQKKNPPTHASLDTPDVSDSWSLILPSIFGNTGVDIVPDKTSNTFTTPDTETIEDERPISTQLLENNYSKEDNTQELVVTEAPKVDVEVSTQKSKPTSVTVRSTTQTTPKKVVTNAATTSKPRTTTTLATKLTTIAPKPTTFKPTYTTRKYHSTKTPNVTVSIQKNKISTQKIHYTSYKPNTVSTTQRVSSVIFEKVNTVTTPSPKTSATSTKKLTTNKPIIQTKVTPSITSTKSYTSTSTTTALPIRKEPDVTTYKPIQSTKFVSLSTTDSDKLDNTTTLTTQSVSPSTTISTTEYMNIEKVQSSSTTPNDSAQLSTTSVNEESLTIPDIPVFDVAQSISQIASDLGNDFPKQTTSNIYETTNLSTLDVESKESLEMDIPSDIKNDSTTNNPSTENTQDTFIQLSTIDPSPESNINKTNLNKTKYDIILNETVSSSTTTIDPILSESMGDLLSQIVNEAPQSILEPSDSTSTLEPVQSLPTVQSTTQTITYEKIVQLDTNINDTKTEIGNNVTAQPVTESIIENVVENITEKISDNYVPISTLADIVSLHSSTKNPIFPIRINLEKDSLTLPLKETTDKYVDKENFKNNDTQLLVPDIVSLHSSTKNPIFPVRINLEKDSLTLPLKETTDKNVDKENFKNNDTQLLVPDIKNVPIASTTIKPEIEKQTNVNKFIVENFKNKEKNTSISNNINISIPQKITTVTQKVTTKYEQPKEDFKKKIQKVNIDDKELADNIRNSSWKLISTVSPPNGNEISKDKIKISESNLFVDNNDQHKEIVLDGSQENQGLEVTTKDLAEDIFQFTELCNELAFRYWNTISQGIDKKRSFVLSPYSITSMLAMMFMGARGATSGEMNEILKLDDMVTFNPHFILKNISDSIETSPETGIAVSAFIRELYSDREKGNVLTFFKERAQHFYNGHVEEINFKLINDIIRRRTNLLIKRHTWGKIAEYMKSNAITMQPPLAAFSTNIFETDCSASSVDGRDGEMYFVVSPNVRQRRLVPVPAVVYKNGLLAGYDPVLDATAAAIGTTNSMISTLFVMPGQQGNVVHAEDLEALERRLLDSNPTIPMWNRLLRTLLPRIGLELQIPRFAHKSTFNISSTLKVMGLKDLFNPDNADLGGLNGPSKDLYLSDMIQTTNFVTCGEGVIGEQHHIEEYPESIDLSRRRRTSRWAAGWDEPRDYQRAFHDPHDVGEAMHLPLHLRPRQARLPARNAQPARLKYDRPFLYFVRHNPTGMILYVGRYNPRLLP